MTKRERILNYLAGKEVDRVPLAFFHHFCPFSEFGMGVDDDRIFEKNIVGHSKAKELFDPDLGKIMNDSLFFMPVDGSMVHSAADLDKIVLPEPDSKYMRRSLELTKRVREIYADTDVPVYATSVSPSFVLRNALVDEGVPGINGREDTIHKYVQQDPEAVSAAVQKIAKRVIEMNRMLITEGGVDGIYMSVNNQNRFFNEDIYCKFILPYEKQVLDEANQLSSMNILHLCGMAGRANNLSLYKEFEAAAYNWAVYAENVSLTEGKKLFHGKPVFGGFKQTAEIYQGPREALEQKVYEILDEVGQVGVMLGADCTVPADIDDRRFGWVRDAAARYADEKRK